MKKIQENLAPALIWMLIAFVATVLTAVESRPSPSAALATVNGEPIELGDFLGHIGMFHGNVEQASTTMAAAHPMELLDRVIAIKLVVQEARIIGLDELPQVTKRLEEGRMGLLRRIIAEERAKKITKADPAVTDAIYRKIVHELELDSVLFQEEADAAAFKAALDEGADFAILAKDLMSQGKAMTPSEHQFIKASELIPEVSETALSMSPGEVSSPIQLANGFTVVKLFGNRYPEDPDARTTAEEQALVVIKQKNLQTYSTELRDRYSDINRDLVEALDYSSMEALAAYKQDDRIVAEIENSEPISVAELSQRLEKKFWHGIEGPIERNSVNSEIWPVLDRIIMERVATLESKRLGIENLESYKSGMRRMEEGLLFSLFLSRVIDSEITLNDDDLRAYYAQHALEFTSSEMIRLDELVFESRDDAEATLSKLQKGADWLWMKEHASGQLEPNEDDAEVLLFSRRWLAQATLPEGVSGTLAGASEGDYRFYGDGSGPFYVLLVEEIRPPIQQEFETVREQISTHLLGQERQRRLDYWNDQLRAASDIEVLVDESELRSMIGMSGEDT